MIHLATAPFVRVSSKGRISRVVIRWFSCTLICGPFRPWCCRCLCGCLGGRSMRLFEARRVCCAKCSQSLPVWEVECIEVCAWQIPLSPYQQSIAVGWDFWWLRYCGKRGIGHARRRDRDRSRCRGVRGLWGCQLPGGWSRRRGSGLGSRWCRRLMGTRFLVSALALVLGPKGLWICHVEKCWKYDVAALFTKQDCGFLFPSKEMMLMSVRP